MGGWEDWRMGGLEDGRMGGWEDGRMGGWERLKIAVPENGNDEPHCQQAGDDKTHEADNRHVIDVGRDIGDDDKRGTDDERDE